MMRTFLFASLALLAACRTKHLSDDTNVAYRAAFAAQRASDPDRTPEFGVDDAARTDAARRGETTKPGAVSGAALLPVAPMSQSSGGAWPGATGSISLEAK
jgi:hypothetical protein